MKNATRPIEALLLACALVLAWRMVLPEPDRVREWDALHVYLPMARAFLAEGWSYLQRPESIVVGPVAFLVPALFGGDDAVARGASVAAYVATVALAYLALRRAHSWQAGVAVALLLALSPTLQPAFGDVMSEPWFVLLLAAWALAVAHVEAADSRVGWIVAGGVALGLATLTRPAVMYFAPLMLVVLKGSEYFSGFLKPRDSKSTLTPLAAMYAMALAISLAWIVRNAVVFGFPSIATGAGAALWFGSNPLVDGFEPAYFGMSYDSGLVQDDNSHLTIRADRTLRAVTAIALRDTPLAVLAEMYVHKAFAFLFVTSAFTAEPLGLQRSWRIALVVLAVAAVATRRRSPLVIALGALAGYMVAAHVPVMYHHRYSVGALDLPLTLLAAIGLVEAFRTPLRLWATLTALALGVGIGLIDMACAGPLPPRPERVAHEVVWERNIGSSYPVGRGSMMVDIDIDKDPRSEMWDLSMVQLDLAIAPETKSGTCVAVRLRYRTAQESDFLARGFSRRAVKADGRMRTLTFGTTTPLNLHREGVLRLEFECTSPTTVEIGKMAILTSQHHRHYWARYLEQRKPGKDP